MKIEVKNNIYEIEKEVTLEEFIKSSGIDNEEFIVSANVNNVPQDLKYVIKKDCSIEFIDISSILGQRIYRTSLSFLFIKASYDVLNKAKVELCHTLSKGQYCEIEGHSDISYKDLFKIKDRMQELIDLDLPFERTRLTKEEAIELFIKIKKKDHVDLLNTSYKEIVNVYTLDGYVSYFTNRLVPSTGYLKLFDIIKEDTGVVLMCPSPKDPNVLTEHKKQDKLLAAFTETKKWGNIMNVNHVSELNRKIINGEYKELVRTIEALHEAKIAEIARTIKEDNKKLILIAGPSSSGKTSTAKRIAVQLKVLGLSPVSISLDDYFIERDKTPLDEFGQKDYESIYAIDLDKFNEDLKALLNGQEIALPTYNFKSGKREYKGNTLRLKDNQSVILEGIHGLNPLLTKSIEDKDKFKIYISPITQLNLDRYNRLSSTDARLIRRIVRDFRFRGHNAEATFEMWDSVRRGEEKNIFPFQEEADIIMNSTLIYELPVLKKYLEPLLIAVPITSKFYPDAKRLLELVSYFVQQNDEKDIPPTSILREFIGESRLLED